jgi:Tfp pilus assembly protein PilF
MSHLQKIEEFIKKNPAISAKKLSKKFNLRRCEAEQLLTYYKLPANRKKTEKIPECIEKISKKSFLPDLAAKIIRFFEKNFFSSSRFAISLFLGAFLIRLYYFFQLKQNPDLMLPLLDAEYYVRWANDILHGGGIGTSAFFTEPMYAYLLALITKIFTHPVEILLLLQFFTGSLLPLLILKIGEKTFSRAVGAIAGIISALYGPFIFYDGLLLKTTFETVSLVFLTLIFLKLLEPPGLIKTWLTGMLLGTIILIKGNSLILLPFLLYTLYKHVPYQTKIQQRKALALFIIGTFLIISPITVRNYLVSKSFVLTNYSIGMVLYQGNWWGGDGSTLPQPSFIRPHPKYEEIDSYKMAEAYLGKPLRPSEVSSFWVKKAILETISSPGHWLASTFRKLILLLTFHEISDNYSYSYYSRFIPLLKYLFQYYQLLTFAGAGILLSLIYYWNNKKDHRAAENPALPAPKNYNHIFLLSGITFSYIALLFIGNVNSRYRVPIIPFFIIFAAYFLWWLLWRIKTNTFPWKISILSTLTILLCLSILPLKLFSLVTDANSCHNLGIYYLEKKDLSKAKDYFYQTIAIDPAYAWAYNNLFYIYLYEENITEASNQLRQAILIRSDNLSNYENLKLLKKARTEGAAAVKDEITALLWQEQKNPLYDPDFYEATRWTAQKNPTKAEKFLEASITNRNAPVNSLIQLAAIKKTTGDSQEAKKLLTQAVQQDPMMLPARYNLANIYINENDYSQVARLLQPVYEDAPELGDTWYNLTVAYIKIQNFEQATKLAEAYVTRYSSYETKKDKVEKFKNFLLQNQAAAKLQMPGTLQKK